MKKMTLLLAIILVIALFTAFAGPAPLGPAAAGAQSQPVARAVLFYSPTCPHCHYVIDEVLPPLVEQYGDQLQILGVNTSQQVGAQLYQAMVAKFQLPRERMGVPALVVDDVVLVGSGEIPAQFPGMIEAGLAAGGIDWPDIPELQLAYPSLFEEAGAETAEEAAEEPETSSTVGAAPGESELEEAVGEEAVAGPLLEAEAAEASALDEASDPVGFVLAAFIAIAMLGTLGYVAWQLGARRLSVAAAQPIRGPWLPLLLLVGLAVALYLSYVEITQVEAVCGPVGDCNVVQSSEYAKLLGIPIGVLGVVGYLLIGALWLVQRRGERRWLPAATTGLLVLAAAGTLFSLYLTMLELFVIEAVCAWCLTSAVVMTGLLVVVVLEGGVLLQEAPTGTSREASGMA